MTSESCFLVLYIAKCQFKIAADTYTFVRIELSSRRRWKFRFRNLILFGQKSNFLKILGNFVKINFYLNPENLQNSIDLRDRIPFRPANSNVFKRDRTNPFKPFTTKITIIPILNYPISLTFIEPLQTSSNLIKIDRSKGEQTLRRIKRSLHRSETRRSRRF